MSDRTSTYQRLPGKKRGFFGHHTLWKSADHLLQICSRFGVEDYKRFYFNDIQAIVTRKTETGKIINFVLGALVGLFGLFAVTSDGGWFSFNTVVAGAVFIWFAFNVFRGPTCKTHLFTAVQMEELHSLHRLNVTQPVLNQLRLVIEQHQGKIDTDALIRQSARPIDSRTQGAQSGGPRKTTQALKPEKGRLHFLLFTLLIIDGLIVAGGFMLTHLALTLMNTAITMMMGICVVVALVKQHESNLKKSLRSITWVALGYVCFSFFTGYILSVGIAFKNPQIMHNQWELFKMISSITPWQSPVIMTLNIVALGAAMLIGITGLFMLKNPQQNYGETSALKMDPVHPVDPKRIS